MVLVLLILLAVLLWIIQKELNATAPQEPFPAGQCPACQAAIDIDWMVCPHCQQRLRESCCCCHRGKLIQQEFCPFCGQGSEEEAA